MQSLLETLEQYAEENMVSKKAATPEYRQARLRLEQHWDAFRATLTEEQAGQLEALRAEEADFRRMEDLSYFRAALSIGMELSRL